MNNVFNIPEPERDNSKLVERQSEVIRVLAALKAIEDSREWSTLKDLVFEGRIETLEGQLKSESKKDLLDQTAIYRLQGRILEAKRLANLPDTYSAEAKHIKNALT